MSDRRRRRPLSPNVAPTIAVARAVLDWCEATGEPATDERIVTMAHHLRCVAREIKIMPPVAAVRMVVAQSARARGVSMSRAPRPCVPAPSVPVGPELEPEPLDLDAL